jgi:hypothetical protein
VGNVIDQLIVIFGGEQTQKVLVRGEKRIAVSSSHLPFSRRNLDRSIIFLLSAITAFL